MVLHQILDKVKDVEGASPETGTVEPANPKLRGKSKANAIDVDVLTTCLMTAERRRKISAVVSAKPRGLMTLSPVEARTLKMQGETQPEKSTSWAKSTTILPGLRPQSQVAKAKREVHLSNIHHCQTQGPREL